MTEKIKKLNSVRLLKAVLHASSFPPEYIARCNEELVHRGFPKAYIADLIEALESETRTGHGAKAVAFYKRFLQAQRLHRISTFSLIMLPLSVAGLFSSTTIGALFTGLAFGLLTILIKTLARTSFRKALGELSKLYSYE